MVPGLVAGQYRPNELTIDVASLAKRASARMVIAKALGVEANNKQIRLQDKSSIRYDIASFDIGSTVAGLDLPGVRDNAIPTRPISEFIRKVQDLSEQARKVSYMIPFRVVVVGGGAGGIEIAFTIQHRLAKESSIPPEVLLLHNARRVLRSSPESLVRRVYRHGQRRRIDIQCNTEVTGVGTNFVELTSGERILCQAVIWVTGAASQPIFQNSGLSTDRRGFVKVRPTLQVEGYDELFAVGDCATLIEHPKTPKAGVYAVRQGPTLVHNIRASLRRESLRSYSPQGDFLALLNLGDGTALGSKWNRSFEGQWVMALKDRIDRRFIRRFRIQGTGKSTLKGLLPKLKGEGS